MTNKTSFSADIETSPPARILGLGSKLPPYQVEQRAVRERVARLMKGHMPDLERLLAVFESAQIDTRHFSLPLEAYEEKADLAQRNRIFNEVARGLCREACRKALREAQVDPTAITHVILVTSTGISTPTLETWFGPEIGLREGVHRLPLWGLGCAGGVAALGLGQALASQPDKLVLIVSVELCSLNFIRDDFSKANLVATALFADGAAAAVLGMEPKPGALMLGHHVEELLPDSHGVMGWDLTARGLQVVFLRRIPRLVEMSYRATVERALKPHELRIRDLTCLATHPGGRKVVEAQERALGLPPPAFAAARSVLRRFGNLSSVTVFLVLEELRRRGLWGQPGLISAFGPGFTSHVMALPSQKNDRHARIRE